MSKMICIIICSLYVTHALAETRPIIVQCSAEGPIYQGYLKFAFNKSDWALKSSQGSTGPVCEISSQVESTFSFNGLTYSADITEPIKIQREAPDFSKTCEQIWETYGFNFFQSPSVYVSSQVGYGMIVTVHLGTDSQPERKISGELSPHTNDKPSGKCIFVVN